MQAVFGGDTDHGGKIMFWALEEHAMLKDINTK